MIDGRTILAVITARGGSKGIPRKNIVPLAGKPLIAWTIEAAKKSMYIDRLILSSDDPEIIDVARQWDCEVPFVRPPSLSGDDIPAVEPLIHAIQFIKTSYDYTLLLQPTSPLRTFGDIDACIEKCVNKRAPACVSVAKVSQSPFLMYHLDESGHVTPLIELRTSRNQRQDLPEVYSLNGAVYVADTEWIIRNRMFLTPETIAYVMPDDHSWDVDTPMDLMLCECLLSRSSS